MANLAQLETSDSDDGRLSETAQLVRRAFNLISADFEESTWTAFWRTSVDGDVPAEVAEDLNISVNAVYKAKSRVMWRLRELLGDLYE